MRSLVLLVVVPGLAAALLGAACRHAAKPGAPAPRAETAVGPEASW